MQEIKDKEGLAGGWDDYAFIEDVEKMDLIDKYTV